MNVLRMAAIVALLLQNVPARPAGTASVEGVVMKLGTNEPIAGADLELTLQQESATSTTPPYTAASGADGAACDGGAGSAETVGDRKGGIGSCC